MQNDFIFAAVFFIAGALLSGFLLRLAKKNCSIINKQNQAKDNSEFTSNDLAAILLRGAAASAFLLLLPWAASFKHLIGAGKIWEPAIAASVFLVIIAAPFIYAHAKHEIDL